MDCERRLTADHMRRLNQVLAGHLSYAAVPKVHSESLSAAPSHGSAIGSFAPESPLGDNGDDAVEITVTSDVRRISTRQALLRRLVRRGVFWLPESVQFVDSRFVWIGLVGDGKSERFERSR